MTKPKFSCPNCGNTEWTRNTKMCAIPRLHKDTDGEPYFVFTEGISVRIFWCSKCNFGVFFKEDI